MATCKNCGSTVKGVTCAYCERNAMDTGLFGGSGNKLKATAKALFAINTVLCVFFGLYWIFLYLRTSDTILDYINKNSLNIDASIYSFFNSNLSSLKVLAVLLGILFIIIGTFSAYIISLLIYGHGEKVTNSFLLLRNSNLMLKNRETEQKSSPVTKLQLPSILFICDNCGYCTQTEGDCPTCGIPLRIYLPQE